MKSGGVITRKNEIEKLDAEIEKLESQRGELSAKAEKLRTESEKLRFDTNAAKSDISEAEADEVRLRAELSSLKSLKEHLTSQSQDSGRQLTESEQKIASANQTIADSEKSLAETEKLIKEAEEKLAEGQDSREKLRMERADLSEKLSELKMHSIEIDKDIQAQQDEIKRVDEQAEELKKGSAHFTEEIERQKQLIAMKQSDIERLRGELDNMKSNSDTYLAEIARYQNMHTEQNKLVNEIRSGMKQLNEAKEKLSGEVTRLEERLESTNRDYDYIIVQLHDVYQLNHSEAVELAEKLDDIIAAQAELTSIKNKIRALGSVNVAAIEEYKEVSERYEFLSAQLADVQKSKNELEKIISDLTEEMCRIFSESFRVINSNFKEIFVELFGGGKAELILSDPENVLESGIEISVAPPGKVIKNLISLSGGEQSFVAIAIYFAILRLRPAPFCILDEIDAALDEVNVRKYAQYLKKFTDTTQFVLVTHRRSAMEEANVLYGVTMQEDGISKLLKMEQVDFQEDVADIQ